MFKKASSKLEIESASFDCETHTIHLIIKSHCINEKDSIPLKEPPLIVTETVLADHAQPGPSTSA